MYIISVCTSKPSRNFGTLFQNFLKCSKIFYVSYKLLRKLQNTWNRLTKLFCCFLEFRFTSKLLFFFVMKFLFQPKKRVTQPHSDTNVNKTHYWCTMRLCIVKQAHKTTLKWHFCTMECTQNYHHQILVLKYFAKCVKYFKQLQTNLNTQTTRFRTNTSVWSV